MSKPSKVMLFADAESLRHPGLIGLDGVDLDSCPWLEADEDARSVRSRATSGELDEVWAFSTDEMSALNLAAAIKKDAPDVKVFIVSFEVSGSLASRARAAGVNGVLTRQGFVRRFAFERARRGAAEIAVSQLEDAASATSASSAQCEDHHAERAGLSSDTRFGADSVDADVVRDRFLPDECAPQHERPSDESLAFVLAVVSGSGGAGKSVTTAVAAHSCAKRGLRTLMVDCDLQFGDLRYLQGEDSPLTLDEVIEDARRIDELASSVKRGLPALIAAPRNLESADEVAGCLPEVIGRAARLFDVVVINTGAHWAEHHAVLLELSTSVLFLIDQRASSVRACKHALDLCRRCGIATGSFLFAVNRCARGSLLTSIDVSCALQGAHVVELRDGGSMVEELLGAGLAGELFAVRNDYCESVAAVVDDLLPEGKSHIAPARASSGASSSFAGARPRRRGRRRRRFFLPPRADGPADEGFEGGLAKREVTEERL